jgi:tetratricopeptide (TPR) repeat protein
MDNAQRTMKRAYETSQSLADPAVRANAACGWARTVALLGEYADARRLIDGALGQVSDEARFDDIAAACLVERGFIASTEGDPDATIEDAQRALERLRIPGSFPAIRTNALHLLAMGYDMRGETANADRSFGQVMEQLERIGLEDTNAAATLLNNWALTHAGRPRSAGARHRRAGSRGVRGCGAGGLLGQLRPAAQPAGAPRRGPAGL